jgi:hypothetical protein
MKERSNGGLLTSLRFKEQINYAEAAKRLRKARHGGHAKPSKEPSQSLAKRAEHFS